MRSFDCEPVRVFQSPVLLTSWQQQQQQLFVLLSSSLDNDLLIIVVLNCWTPLYLQKYRFFSIGIFYYFGNVFALSVTEEQRDWVKEWRLHLTKVTLSSKDFRTEALNHSLTTQTARKKESGFHCTSLINSTGCSVHYLQSALIGGRTLEVQFFHCSRYISRRFVRFRRDSWLSVSFQCFVQPESAECQ